MDLAHGILYPPSQNYVFWTVYTQRELVENVLQGNQVSLAIFPLSSLALSHNNNALWRNGGGDGGWGHSSRK